MLTVKFYPDCSPDPSKVEIWERHRRMDRRLFKDIINELMFLEGEFTDAHRVSAFVEDENRYLLMFVFSTKQDDVILSQINGSLSVMRFSSKNALLKSFYKRYVIAC